MEKTRRTKAQARSISKMEAEELFLAKVGSRIYLMRRLERSKKYPNPNWRGTGAALVCEFDSTKTFAEVKANWIEKRTRVNLF